MINYFNFKKWGDKYLITNDIGRFMFISEQEFDDLVHDRVNYDSEFGIAAKQNMFCYDGSALAFSETIKSYYREAKNYLFSSSCLHIFVLTNMCNLNCIYCQAHTNNHKTFSKMTKDIAKKAVDIALSVPDRELSFEFQGGEPLLNFDTIRFIVEYANEKAIEKHKVIAYNLVSNLTTITDEIADFLVCNNINISTSIDGSCNIHNLNRPQIDGTGSYERTLNGIKMIRSKNLNYGAIQTTSRYSLSKYKEIIDAYVESGLDCIFLRNLTPLGNANENWDKIGYSPEDYLEFYKKGLDYIIEINKKGTYFTEKYASILLRKILSGYSLNYMELRSPCGAGIGQIAYNYDGSIYTCDEGRMLAEMGIDTFKLGDINNSYDELMNSNVCKATIIASFLESLPDCCDCVYSPYCGKCPIITYAIHNSIYDSEPNEYKCKINRGILDIIFDYLNDKEIRHIFETWIN